MTPQPARARLDSIDLLRGVVMVVMLLDHSRDFLHREGLTGDPTDPATTTAALFFTRWITHFCAPLFVLLAGVSARLSLDRSSASVADLAAARRAHAGHLLRRGLFLVGLELVVLRPLIWFNLDLSFLAHLQVIWATGWAMVALGLLLRLRLPPMAIGLLGVALVAGHNLVPHASFTFTSAGGWEALVVVLLRKGALQLGEEGPIAMVQYPLLPWFGVLACGFALGALWQREPAARRGALSWIGLAACALFLLLRGGAWYGEPSDWGEQPSAWRTLFSFLRLEKYPPSLQYLLMMAGPGLLALSFLPDALPSRLARPLLTLGRAPLFYYVLQWPAVHLCARLFQLLAGQPQGWDSPNPMTLGTELPPGCGFSLPVVYAGFALCLVILLPLTAAFARFKASHPHLRWLRYV